MTWVELVKYIPPIVNLAADAVTVILGSVALWGLVFRRKQLSLAMRLLGSLYASQRASRLKETLGKLEALSYDNKEDRGEIHALFGQASGQISGLLADYPSLQETHVKISAVVEKRGRLSESLKRQLVYEIHGCIEIASLDQARDTVESTK